MPTMVRGIRTTDLVSSSLAKRDVFEAIACENPFPRDHFPEANFNQLVLKAMFLDVPLDRVLGWRERNNLELRRMAADYAAERRAAGRSVPEGIALIGPAVEATS